MSGYLLAALAFAALIMTFVSSARARATQNGASEKTHSRPIYHGLNAAIWTGVPALIFLLLWLMGQNSVINQLVIASFPGTENLDASARSLILSEIRQVAAGNIFKEPTPEILAAVAHLKSLQQISVVAMAAVVAAGIMLAIMTLPNNFETGDGLNTAGYTWRRGEADDTKRLAVRLDHNLTDRHRISYVYSYEPETGLLSLAATHGLPARSIGRVTMTNTPPNGAFRGFGVPQLASGVIAVESAPGRFRRNMPDPVPIMVLASAVMFLPQINPQLNDLASAQAGAVLDSYFFWSAAFVFPAFVFLRCVAARIYGSTLLKAVQTGAIAEDVLGEHEWRTLHRLNLLQIQPEPHRHPALRAIAWAATRAGRITFGFTSGLVWFTFVAQIFIMQFFNYLGAPGWLNQPLVQLPWFHHVPDTLKNPWGDIFFAALVVFLCWRLKKLVLWAKMRS